MSYLSASELDLLTFFEVAPLETDEKDVPWVYRESVYLVSQDDLTLSVAISPSYRDVRIILKKRGEVLYELNSMGVKDLRYFNEKGLESLKLELNSESSIVIRIKPKIEFQHSYREAT